MINKSIIYKFFKDFNNHKKKNQLAVAFSCRLFPNILNIGSTDETLSSNQDSLRNILKSSASMYESWGSKFLRTITEIQSGPDVFDESRFIMTFLTILGVTEILCSFKLDLEGEPGKGIPESSRLEFLEEFLAKNSLLDGR